MTVSFPLDCPDRPTDIALICRIVGAAQAHTHALLGIFHRDLVAAVIGRVIWLLGVIRQAERRLRSAGYLFVADGRRAHNNRICLSAPVWGMVLPGSVHRTVEMERPAVRFGWFSGRCRRCWQCPAGSASRGAASGVSVLVLSAIPGGIATGRAIRRSSSCPKFRRRCWSGRSGSGP